MLTALGQIDMEAAAMCTCSRPGRGCSAPTPRRHWPNSFCKGLGDALDRRTVAPAGIHC